jgi:hypothetical protein
VPFHFVVKGAPADAKHTCSELFIAPRVEKRQADEFFFDGIQGGANPE